MVAVLLHYFSIVPFMWMLVKGAFLYFTSVKVIEFKVKSYLVTATAISYGVPLLYYGNIHSTTWIWISRQ